MKLLTLFLGVILAVRLPWMPSHYLFADDINENSGAIFGKYCIQLINMVKLYKNMLEISENFYILKICSILTKSMNSYIIERLDMR